MPLCEEKSTSPGEPFTPDELARRTSDDANLTVEARRALLVPVAPLLVTEAHRHYDPFEATLRRGAAADTWDFHASGRLPGGNVTDEYDVTVVVDGGKVSAASPSPTGDAVVAPANLRLIAQEVWRREGGVEVGAAAVLRGAGWSRALPSCVTLHYANDTTGSTRTPTVNVVELRLVDVKRSNPAI